MSVTKEIKEAGAKVTKVMQGEYKYNGINFTTLILNECCESSYWVVDQYEDNFPTTLRDWCGFGYNFQTKKESLQSLLYYDLELSEK